MRSHTIVYLCLTATILIAGFLVCGESEKKFGQKDAPFIVIDEIAAMMILLAFIPRDSVILVIAFLVFRCLDVLKPYPIKKIEKISGSWGIMGDDLLACLYAVFVVRIIYILLERGV